MSEAKWFTGARKFPQLIGRTPDGGKLWGGPYTITQVVIAVIGAIVLANTTGLWMRFSLFGNLVAGPGVLAALVWSAGKLPFGMRNPLIVGSGWLGAAERLLSTPQPVRLRRPHRVGAAVLMIAAPPQPEAPAPASLPPIPAEVREVDPAAVPAPALTGVQKLLLAARS
jgi:hypothetical protein